MVAMTAAQEPMTLGASQEAARTLTDAGAEHAQPFTGAAGAATGEPLTA